MDQDPPRSVEENGLSRRGFLSAGATLLARFGLAAVLPDMAASAAGDTPSTEVPTPADLALLRPVTVSSTDYAPTPAKFAVDRLAEVGVRGSGWRAAQGDPQWMVIDLQG